MLRYRTMQNFSCSFLSYTPFVLGGGFGKPIQPISKNAYANLRDSYMRQVPISICKHLQIRSLYSGRSTFESGNGSRLNLVAHELMRTRSFSSKRKKKLQLKAKSKEGGDGAASEDKRPGDGHCVMHNESSKREKSSVCNIINGQVNAAVSSRKPSNKKSSAKTSKSVSSSTCDDSYNSQKAVEDVSGNKGDSRIHDAGTPVKRKQKPKNKKQDGKEVRQDNTCTNEAAKSSGMVQDAKVPAKRSKKPRNRKLDTELAAGSAAVDVRSSKKKAEGNPVSANSENNITNNISPDSSAEGSNVKKLRPLYPPSGKSVVVVESVTKARVIQNYLGNMYEVLPSYGHLRDLAGRSGSVRPHDDFSMVWEVPASAWTHLKSIKVALNGAENLILASDPDREGEAISWHITEMLLQQDALRDDINVARVVFHEITESSIKSALQAPREIDRNLVNAYLARRALDYLIGFNISPLLWRKLPGCQSAGRVQSAALALICDREMEIEQFNKKEYWTVGVEFYNSGLNLLGRKSSISAHLTHLNSEKLDQHSICSHVKAQEIEKRISSSKFEVLATRTGKVVRNPPMPYITSTLQQDAANKLHFMASYTMKLAQKLYEGIKLSDGEATGLITYMRTDGLHVSHEAAEDINCFVKERYGEKFASKSIRRYFKKVKNAQEAHEAIRPTNIRRLPETLIGIVDDDAQKLYSLIWTRTMACQMEPSTTDTIQVDIGNTDGDMAFRSVASRLGFSGYQEVYKDQRAQITEGDDNGGEGSESSFEVLQNLKVKDSLSLTKVDIQQHYTKPPSRYSEGALVKKLEELGIGRPSTYASIMKVLLHRNYVTMKSRILYPEFRGRMVSAFLSHHFSEVADVSFTADMENELDNVSAGETEWKCLLKNYWSRFSNCCELASKVEIRQVEKMLEEQFDRYLFAGIDGDSRVCPSCSVGTLRFKVSRFGAGFFIGCDQYPKCKHTALTMYGEEDEDTPAEKPEKSFPPKFLGYSPASEEKIFLKKGPYGYYVQLGEDRKGYSPKRASVAEVKDIESITVEDAIELLQYPVTLGNHPDDEHPVLLRHSKSGFSIKHRRTIAPVPKNMEPKEITLDIGLKLLSSKSAKRSGRPKSKPKTEEDEAVSWG